MVQQHEAHDHAVRLRSPALFQCVERHLKDQSYDDKVVGTWVNYICEDVIQGLNDLGKPFKYIGASRRPTCRSHCGGSATLFTVRAACTESSVRAVARGGDEGVW